MLGVGHKFAKLDLVLLRFYGRVYINHSPCWWDAPGELFDGIKVKVGDVILWKVWPDGKMERMDHFVKELKELLPLARARGDSATEMGANRKGAVFKYFYPQTDEEWEALGAYDDNPLGRFCGYELDTRPRV